MTWDLYYWKYQYNVNLRYGWSLILLKKLIIFYTFYYSWGNASCCIYSYIICYCLLHNLPSKDFLIPSSADFVSMWRRIKGAQHQILYFRLLILERRGDNGYPTSIIASSWNANIDFHSIDSQVCCTGNVK